MVQLEKIVIDSVFIRVHYFTSYALDTCSWLLQWQWPKTHSKLGPKLQSVAAAAAAAGAAVGSRMEDAATAIPEQGYL